MMMINSKFTILSSEAIGLGSKRQFALIKLRGDLQTYRLDWKQYRFQ